MGWPACRSAARMAAAAFASASSNGSVVMDDRKASSSGASFFCALWVEQQPVGDLHLRDNGDGNLLRWRGLEGAQNTGLTFHEVADRAGVEQVFHARGSSSSGASCSRSASNGGASGKPLWPSTTCGHPGWLRRASHSCTARRMPSDVQHERQVQSMACCTSFANSRASSRGSAIRPATVPTRSGWASSWLSLCLPSSRAMGISMPTMARNSRSM